MKRRTALFLALFVLPLANTWSAPIANVRDVSALRALSAPTATTDSTVVETAGYATPGDGGGHQFIWSATATDNDNGGTIIRPTAIAMTAPGRWLIPLDRSDYGWRINVKWFGAQGNGTTDDTNAIYAAQAAMQTFPYEVESGHPAGNVWMGELYFPRGTYCLRRVGIPVYPRGVLTGDGPEASGLLFLPNAVPTAASPDDPESFLVRVYRSASNGQVFTNSTHGVHVQGLLINAGSNQPTGAKSSGLFFSGAEISSLENCQIFGLEHALVMDGCGTTSVHNVTAQGSRLEPWVMQNGCNHVFIDVGSSEHTSSSDYDEDGDPRSHFLIKNC